MTALNNLTINNANNVVLNNNITLSGTFTRTSGYLKITVSATGINKTYDGFDTATVNLSSYKITGDNLTYSYSSATFTAGKNAGTGKAVSVTGISLGGTSSGNYTLSSTSAATTADITAKAVTLSGTKTYDGNATFTGGTNLTVSTGVGTETLVLGGTATANSKYYDYKYILDPVAENYRDRFHTYTEELFTYEDHIEVDENVDGSIDYDFWKNDFNVQEFLSNLVIRREYSPGSSVYLCLEPDKERL